MNPSSNIISINLHQYTKRYVIENPGVNQPDAFFIPQNDENAPKPFNNSLQWFYENSPITYNNLQENVGCGLNISKKVDNGLVGNNLKLASILLPKNDILTQHNAPVNNIVLEPVPSASLYIAPPSNMSVVNVVPKLDINSKIVNIKYIPNSTKISGKKEEMPKIKPKKNNQNPSKQSSVQLLKLGETYHSLPQLNDSQIKIVNDLFGNTKKLPKEPAYDPVTNTGYVYKVSSKDLTIIGKDKLIFKPKKVDPNIINNDKEIINKKKIGKKELKLIPSEEGHEQPATTLKTKVTRSGRKVKLPKHHTTEENTLHKPKRKYGTVASCFQCSLEFSSLYRLQRHYENHPTHIPSKIHSNLFHCLLAIIKGGSEEDRANIFIQQLEQLIAKFKSLLPCLLKKVDGDESKLCNINDDIGRLFGMNPGKYNLNMDALNCIKDKEGHCQHNPPKTNQVSLNIGIPSKDDAPTMGTEDENCARINSVAEWPTQVTKRLWKMEAQNNAKKIKLDLDWDVPPELDMDELLVSEKSAPDMQNPAIPPIPTAMTNESVEDENINMIHEQKKPDHVQFQSVHFNILSSPIKQSSTIYNRFQIDPEQIPKHGVHTIKPDGLRSEQQMEVQREHLDSVILNDNVELPSKQVIDNNLDFVCKDFAMNIINEQTDSDIKLSTPFEPALLHFKDDSLSKNLVNTENQKDDWEEMNNHSDQNESELNLYEMLGGDCLMYPETDIRNNSVDFQLDLFPFTDTQNK